MMAEFCNSFITLEGSIFHWQRVVAAIEKSTSPNISIHDANQN